MSKKNTTIFSAESVNANALGMTAVQQNDLAKVLSDSGRSAFQFLENDIVTLYPEQVFAKTVTRKDKDGKDLVDKDNKPVTITRYYYGAVRNNIATLIPVSSIRLTPSFHAYDDPVKAQDEFFNGFDKHRQLALTACNDYERVKMLKDHPTFVVHMKKAKGIDWRNSDMTVRPAKFAYSEQDFPCFDFDAELE